MIVKSINLIEFCQPPNPIALHSALEASLDEPVGVNCTQVQAMPTSIVQVLLVAKRDWTSRALDFHISDMSESCTDALHLIGVAPDEFTPKVELQS